MHDDARREMPVLVRHDRREMIPACVLASSLLSDAKDRVGSPGRGPQDIPRANLDACVCVVTDRHDSARRSHHQETSQIPSSPANVIDGLVRAFRIRS